MTRTIYLTPREIEALTLVAEGMANKEIAAQIGVNVRTVDYHLANVYVKLGAKNRVQALIKAKAAGYLKED